MTTAISSFLSSLQWAEPTVCDNLALVPLLGDPRDVPEFITLEDGLESSLFEVTELEEGASVNDILFLNKSDSYALLIEGEEFLGAMQNRILNVSIFVQPRHKVKLPVSCVEAGRWNPERREPVSRTRPRTTNQRVSTQTRPRTRRETEMAFSLAKERVHYARGRAAENAAVSFSLERSGRVRGNQSGVWQDIEAKSVRMSAESATSASDRMYVVNEKRMRGFLKSLKPLPSQVGSIFIVDGQVSGIDLFANEDTHKKMFPRLVSSHSLDALDSQARRGGTSPEETDNEQLSQVARTFVSQIDDAWTKEFDGLCLGKNLRFKDEHMTGSALTYEDSLLHLCAFRV